MWWDGREEQKGHPFVFVVDQKDVLLLHQHVGPYLGCAPPRTEEAGAPDAKSVREVG